MNDHYYQHDHHQKRHRLAKRFKWFSVGLILAFLIIITILFFTTNLFVQRELTPATSSVRTTIQAPSISIFRTPYFQFQTKDSWVEVTKGIKKGQFFYRSYRGTLVEQDLQVYINPKPVDVFPLKAARILPVGIGSDGSLTNQEGISDHCGKSVKDTNRDPRQVTFKTVTFTCLVDGAIFDVLIGQKNGTILLELPRPNGEKVRIVMYYRDLRANPDGRDLGEIVETFQSR